MKMKIYIDVNEKEIRRDPDWLATFLKGYLSQLAGYKVTDVDLLDDDENKIDKSGLHFQVGMQFKLFVLDSFLFYRHTLGDFEDVLDAKSFGSLNFRIGMGF